jgi:hypothetical protein
MYFMALTASLSTMMVLLGIYTIFFQQQYEAANFFVTILFAGIFGLSVLGIKTRAREDSIPIGN